MTRLRKLTATYILYAQRHFHYESFTFTHRLFAISCNSVIAIAAPVSLLHNSLHKSVWQLCPVRRQCQGNCGCKLPVRVMAVIHSNFLAFTPTAQQLQLWQLYSTIRRRNRSMDMPVDGVVVIAAVARLICTQTSNFIEWCVGMTRRCHHCRTKETNGYSIHTNSVNKNGHLLLSFVVVISIAYF